MAPNSFGKRKNLKDQIEHITAFEGEEGIRMRFEMLETLEKDVQEATTFRWHAPATKKRQDHHLDMYKQFVFTFIEKESVEDKTEDEVDLTLFPDDIPKMKNNMQL